MAAKGSVSKEIITQKILETFDGAFKYDKEIRIPIMEDGVEVQIKVTLTCAKTNVENGMDNAIPGAEIATTTPKAIDSHGVAEVTEEEKQNVLKAMKALGL